MKRLLLLFWLFGISCCWTWCSSVFSQTIITLGSGSDISNSSQITPANISAKSIRTQMVYTSAELTASGMSTCGSISGLAWRVSEDMNGVTISDYTIKFKHVAEGDVTNLDNSGGYTTVYSGAYTSSANVWDQILFSTDFNWDGASNILIDVCWSLGTYAATDQGSIYVYNQAGTQNDMAVIASNATNICSETSPTNVDFKPQIQLRYVAGDPMTSTISATATEVCSGGVNGLGTTNLEVPSAGVSATYQWQERIYGSTVWQNVTAGSGASTANYTTDVLTSKTYFRCEINNSCGTFVSDTISIKVSGCACSASPDNSNNDIITRVVFDNGAIDNSTAAEVNGYGDYTDLLAGVNGGNTYTLEVTINATGRIVLHTASHVFAWVDWDKNGSFNDAGEAYDLGETILGGNQTLNGNILVPNGVLDDYILRVAVRFNNDPTSCDDNTVTGEVEDYTIATCDQTVRWLGLVNNQWQDPGNWDSGLIPLACSDVVIPITPNNPLFSDNTDGAFDCKSITIEQGAALTIQNNAVFNLDESATINGQLTNNGQFLMDENEGNTFLIGDEGVYTHNPFVNNAENTMMLTGLGVAQNFSPTSVLNIEQWYDFDVPLATNMDGDFGTIQLNPGIANIWAQENSLANKIIFGDLVMNAVDFRLAQQGDVGNVVLDVRGDIVVNNQAIFFGLHDFTASLAGTDNNLTISATNIKVDGGMFYGIRGFAVTVIAPITGEILINVVNDIHVLNSGQMDVRSRSLLGISRNDANTTINANRIMVTDGAASRFAGIYNEAILSFIDPEVLSINASQGIFMSDGRFYGQRFDNMRTFIKADSIHLTGGMLIGQFSSLNSAIDFNVNQVDVEAGVVYGNSQDGGNVLLDDNDGNITNHTLVVNATNAGEINAISGVNAESGTNGVNATGLLTVRADTFHVDGGAAEIVLSDDNAVGDVIGVVNSVVLSAGRLSVKQDAGAATVDVVKSYVQNGGNFDLFFFTGGNNNDEITINVSGPFTQTDGLFNFNNNPNTGDRILNMLGSLWQIDGGTFSHIGGGDADVFFMPSSDVLSFNRLAAHDYNGRVRQTVVANKRVNVQPGSDMELASIIGGGRDHLNIYGVLDMGDGAIISDGNYLNGDLQTGLTMYANSLLRLSNSEGFFDLSIPSKGCLRHRGSNEDINVILVDYELDPNSTIEFYGATDKVMTRTPLGRNSIDRRKYANVILSSNAQRYTLDGDAVVRGVITVNNNGVLLNEQRLILENTSTAAMTTTSGGYVIAEDDQGTTNEGRVDWNVGTTAAAYSIPFYTGTDFIPFTFEKVGGNDIGYVSIGTFPTDDYNLPYAPTVFHVNDGGEDASLRTVDRFWNIDLDNAFTTGSANLYFTYPEIDADVSGDSILVAKHWNGTTWDDGNITAPNGQVHDRDANTVVAYGVNDFSPFILQEPQSGTVLPVSWLSFDAVKMDENVVLTWEVMEYNVDYYEVERSIDGYNFESIGLLSRANEQVNNQYKWIDSAVIAGRNHFYRILQKSKNGASSYSVVKEIQLASSDAFQLDVFPNPASTEVSIRTNLTDGFEIEIFDNLGTNRVWKVEVAPNTLHYKLPVDQLRPGIYWLTISNKKHQIVKQLVVME